MSTYIRLSDKTFHDLTPERFALLQANGKAADLRAYSVDARPMPSALQKVESGPRVLDATTARDTWLLLAKTVDDLSAEQAATDRALDITQIKAVLTALKNGTGTQAERMARVERVLFRLAKDQLL